MGRLHSRIHRPCGMTLHASRANCKRGIAVASWAKWSDSQDVNQSLGLAALGYPDSRDVEQGIIGKLPAMTLGEPMEKRR